MKNIQDLVLKHMESVVKKTGNKMTPNHVKSMGFLKIPTSVTDTPEIVVQVKWTFGGESHFDIVGSKVRNVKPKYLQDFRCPHCGGDAVALDAGNGELLIWCSAGCVVVEGKSAKAGQELVHDSRNHLLGSGV